MATYRAGQRMYGAPVKISVQPFIPSPEGLFGSGGGSSSGSSNSSSSSSSGRETDGGKYMRLHEMGMEQEKYMLKTSLNVLQNKAYNLLKDEYGGNVARFQEGEMQKYMDDPNGDNFYALMQKQHMLNSQYYGNEAAAATFKKQYDLQYEKIKTDNAFGQVLETDDSRPIYNYDGTAVRIVEDDKGAKFYVSADGNSDFKPVQITSKNENIPFMRQQDHMNNVFNNTGYVNGQAVNAKYYETVDMTKSHFQNRLQTIAQNVKTAMNTREGNQLAAVTGLEGEQIVNGLANKTLDKNQSAQAAKQGYVFLANVVGKVSTNYEAIQNAVNLVMNSMSEIEKKDARQEWYKFQESGYGIKDPETGKMLSGKDIPFEVFIADRARSVLTPVAQSDQSNRTSISELPNFNEAATSSKATTPLAAVTNPSFIARTGVSTDFVVPIKNKDGQMIAKPVSGYKSNTMTPMMTADINSKYFVNYNETDPNKRYYQSPEILGQQIMLANGSLVNTAELYEAGWMLAGVTGTSYVTPQHKRDAQNNRTNELVRVLNEDGYYEDAIEPALEYELVSVGGKRTGRKGINVLAPDESTGGSKNKAYVMKEGLNPEEIQKEYGGVYKKDADETERIFLKVIAGVPAGVMFDGSINTASKNNYNQLNDIVQRDARKALLHESLDEISVPIE